MQRRSFLVTTLGAGFAVAVQPVMAQTAIVTDATGLLAGEVGVPVADGTLVAYRAAPPTPGAPVVLVVSEIFGVHEHIKDICRRLARAGYFAIAPELFARQGDPRSMTSIPDILNTIVARTPDAQVLGDLDACVSWAQQQGGNTDRLAVTGFCWGGRITWLYAAHQPKLRAAVAWYGRLVGEANANTPRHPVDIVDDLQAPVLGLYGGADPGIPPETVEKMRQRLAASANPKARVAQIRVYDQAPHAFHADYRPSYRKADADDGWARLLAWFRENGV
jgi:carboxymethylenebutenolidase